MEVLATRLRLRILKARTAARLSQADLASAIDVQPTAISKIESGNREVSSTELARIAETCGVPFDWFFREADDDTLVVSMRSDGTSSEALKDLAWAREFSKTYVFLKSALSR